MADLSILITGLVLAGGYLLKKNKEKYTNIYTSNHIQEAQDFVAKKALEKEIQSLDPEVTGMYNTNLRGGKAGRIDTTGPRPERPKGPLILPLSPSGQLSPASSSRDFSKFSTLQSPSIIDGGEIAPHGKSIMPFAKSFDTTTNDEKFSNVMREHTGTEKTRRDESSETESFYNGIKVSNTPGTTFRDHVSDDRFIASSMKQGEKPFEPVIIGAPIAWTVDNPIQSRDFIRTIEETTVNPKQTYGGRVVEGVRASEGQMGILGEVSVKAPPTTSEKQFLRAGPALGQAPAIKENLSNLQATARGSYNSEHVTPAMSAVPGASVGIMNYTASTKTSLEGSYIRNMGTSVSGVIGDYSRHSLTNTDTERTSYTDTGIRNTHNQNRGTYIKSEDGAKTTSQETLRHTGDMTLMSVQVKEPGNTLFHRGTIDVTVKPTSKQYTNEGYSGSVSSTKSMGYLVNPVSARTSLKEIMSPEYNGNMGSSINMGYLITPVNIKSSLKDLMNPEYIAGGGIKTISGKEAVGQATVNSTKLLAERKVRPAAPSLSNSMFVTPTKDSVGIFTQDSRDNMKMNTASGDRFIPELVTEQLKHNPFVIKTTS